MTEHLYLLRKQNIGWEGAITGDCMPYIITNVYCKIPERLPLCWPDKRGLSSCLGDCVAMVVVVAIAACLAGPGIVSMLASFLSSLCSSTSCSVENIPDILSSCGLDSLLLDLQFLNAHDVCFEFFRWVGGQEVIVLQSVGRATPFVEVMGGESEAEWSERDEAI